MLSDVSLLVDNAVADTLVARLPSLASVVRPINTARGHGHDYPLAMDWVEQDGVQVKKQFRYSPILPHRAEPRLHTPEGVEVVHALYYHELSDGPFPQRGGIARGCHGEFRPSRPANLQVAIAPCLLQE